MFTFSPGTCAGAISSCSLSQCSCGDPASQWRWRPGRIVVTNKYPCLKAHCNTQALETDLCAQMQVQKSITKQEFPLHCNLSPSQVIQKSLQTTTSRDALYLLWQVPPLHKKGDMTTCLWSCENAFVLYLFPFESILILHFNICRLKCQI